MPYCQYCGQEFRTDEDCVVHEEREHNACPDCEEAFETQEALRLHREEKHTGSGWSFDAERVYYWLSAAYIAFAALFVFSSIGTSIIGPQISGAMRMLLYVIAALLAGGPIIAAAVAAYRSGFRTYVYQSSLVVFFTVLLSIISLMDEGRELLTQWASVPALPLFALAMYLLWETGWLDRVLLLVIYAGPVLIAGFAVVTVIL